MTLEDVKRNIHLLSNAAYVEGRRTEMDDRTDIKSVGFSAREAADATADCVQELLESIKQYKGE